MVKAAATLPNGKKLFIFGLSAANVKHLKDGKPMSIDLVPLGGEGQIAILFGETEADIANELRIQFGPLPGDPNASA